MGNKSRGSNRSKKRRDKKKGRALQLWHQQQRGLAETKKMECTIKIEPDTALNEGNSTSEMNLDNVIFQDHVSYDNDRFASVILEVKQESVSEENVMKSKYNEMKLDSKFHNKQIKVKKEVQTDEDNIVSYDYPNFNETGSLDSNDSIALENVEACLQDEINIKIENYCHNVTNRNENTIQDDLKIEPGLTITETHLTLEASSVTNTNRAEENNSHLVKMETQINGKNIAFDVGGDVAVLDDDSYNINIKMEQQMIEQDEETANEHFQLNSITGNVMTLEQEVLTLKRAKERTHVCPKCPKSFYNKTCLRNHLKVHLSIEKFALGRINARKKRLLKVKGPKKKYPLYEYVEDNGWMSPGEDSYHCTCGKVYRRRTRMETCLRSHNLSEAISSNVSCLSCTQQFPNKYQLKLHRKRLHRKKFPCKFCPTDYNTRKELFKHLQIHQKVQLMEYKVISEVIEGKQILRCFMCPKTWTELSELKTHVLNEHKGPYLCPHCKNTFPKIIDFGNHTKTYHPEVEGQSVLNVIEAFSRLVQAWKCEECELQFLEADKLAMHQVEMHSPELKNEKQFQCTDCRRVFISQKGLTSHRRIHHKTDTVEETPEIIQGIMCLECRKMCKDMTALTSHMRLHSPDRKYPCKFCDFRFATPEKRKTHAEIHTGDMRFVCFICEYQCSSENRLNQHKTTSRHINMKEYLLTGKPLDGESTSKDIEKEVSTKKRKKDKDPCREESDSEVPCDICGEKFASEKSMLDHKQTHPFIEFPNDDKQSRIFFK